MSPDESDQLRTLCGELVRRIGPELAGKAAGEVRTEITPRGRVAVRVGSTLYFAAGREIVAAVERGGRVEYSHVLEDGTLEPVAAGALDPGSN